MHLTILHKSKHHSTNGNSCLLQAAVSSEVIADIIFDELTGNHTFANNGNPAIAVPEKWNVKPTHRKLKILHYNREIPANPITVKQNKADHWFILSNGRFVTHMDCKKIKKILTCFDTDMIAINADIKLLPYQEHAKITSCGNVVGFRRLYHDSVLPAAIPTDWPHHLFIKFSALNKTLTDGALPTTFADLVNRCKSKSLTLHSFRIAGNVLDLETEAGLLRFLTTRLRSMRDNRRIINHYSNGDRIDSCKISDNARIFGNVAIGKNVQIDDDAVIVGPTVLGDKTRIAKAAVIKASVIGPNLSMPKNRCVQNQIFLGPKSQHKLLSGCKDKNSEFINTTDLLLADKKPKNNNFRNWPTFSYAIGWKRIADILASLIALLLCAPVFPVIALVIKLSSPGPVFFRHKREGLHGKEYHCLKFRTMITGADQIQGKLRAKNQVDGPQFKIKSDPRITAVGKFMRDTFIDEIPQFINILLGQMSVVGPRPSPKAENSLCPFWRDARLSVRPGITGLWQIRRTRRPGRDFQEWIYYDTRYVRGLSPSLDLWICLQTARKLIANFLDQF